MMKEFAGVVSEWNNGNNLRIIVISDDMLLPL